MQVKLDSKSIRPLRMAFVGGFDTATKNLVGDDGLVRIRVVDDDIKDAFHVPVTEGFEKIRIFLFEEGNRGLALVLPPGTTKELRMGAVHFARLERVLVANVFDA